MVPCPARLRAAWIGVVSGSVGTLRTTPITARGMFGGGTGGFWRMAPCCHVPGSWQHGRMRVLRTPEDRFADLPDFPYPPRYAAVGGVRLAYVEAGPPDGEPVLLLHGEPSWSFLYRTVMGVLADAGLRAIAPDMAGFGRSDKPLNVSDRSEEH